MKKAFLISFIFCLSIVNNALSQDSTRTEKSLKIVPLLTSSPLLGFGAGAAVSFLYATDQDISSKSQLQVGGQYSVTNSYNVFVNNNAWFKQNKILSISTFSLAGINNEFKIDTSNVAYNSSSVYFSEAVFYRVRKHFYIGVPLLYRGVKFRANNEAGQDFLDKNGVVDEKSGGAGLAISFDTRTNKYYPSKAAWVVLSFIANPSWLGTLDTYHNMVINARYYAKGFSYQDVWAWQAYGQFASNKAPDSGLPTLSGKAMLRGYPAGKYKARNMTGVQTEYRYTIGHSRFRMVGFFGVANLSGGSFGQDGNSRNDDGWYSSGGLGARYALQPKTGIDLRLDAVRTSDGDYAFYLMLNQAF